MRPLTENLVRFRLYTNYRSFIERAEVRIFEEDQSLRDTPLAVIAMDADGMAQWQPQFESSPRRCAGCNTWCAFTTARDF
jgi:hypothetical protein